MNKYLDIIPTPKYCKYEQGEALEIKSVCVVGESGNILRSALELLEKECSFKYVDCDNAKLVLYSEFDKIPKEYLTKEDRRLFEEKYAEEQGYIIKMLENNQIVVAACSQMGCAYAVMTLLQILHKEVKNLVIRDVPDFRYRGIKWLIWAETGCWSYDFGDGKEAIKKRFERKLDMLFKYKINYVHADGFGFDADRFEGYAEIMRHLCDCARKRGIKIAAGGYTMSYGMVGHLNSYQGKDFWNRKCYPDGEIYSCIGTYEPKPEYAELNWEQQLMTVRGRERGTCLSNEVLFEEKMKEITDFIKKTHITAISFHNMDADEIHPELWAVRCAECRKHWPNDSLFARDGAAGAFAEFIDKVMKRVGSIKDGDYDSSKDLIVRMASPGYLYEWTKDEVFETGIKFWSAVTNYMTEGKNFAVGFREQFFYHNKNVERAKTVVEYVTNAMKGVGNFNGCDGFYDDKLFNITSSIGYILKGYDSQICFNGNAFQEPLAIFNAEYLWNCENSGFYNYAPRPKNYEEYKKLYQDMIQSKVRPAEVYGDNGFIDIICKKLYGEKIGLEMAKIYKLGGKNGEPPIPCASSVDLYTNYTKVVYPMRWDNEEITKEKIAEMTERFHQCSIVSIEASNVMKNVMVLVEEEEQAILENACDRLNMVGMKEDLTWLADCFYMGSRLCTLLYEYMLIYTSLHEWLMGEIPYAEKTVSEIERLREKIREFNDYLAASTAKPVDKFGGSMIRRQEMGEFLDYNTMLMLSSIKTNKRIPDDRKPLRTRNWW